MKRIFAGVFALLSTVGCGNVTRDTSSTLAAQTSGSACVVDYYQDGDWVSKATAYDDASCNANLAACKTWKRARSGRSCEKNWYHY